MHPGLNLRNLAYDLQPALAALKKKEEDLQEAEMKVMLEHGELNQANKDLDRLEENISAYSSKCDELEEELKQGNLNLAMQATELEDLKLQVKEKDQEIFVGQEKLKKCWRNLLRNARMLQILNLNSSPRVSF